MITKPVVFENIDSADFKAVLFAEMGLSNQFISKETGLSFSQISYRTRQAHVYRKDYRNGTNDMAQRALAKVNTLVNQTEQKEKGGIFAQLRVQTLERDRKVRAAKAKAQLRKVKKLSRG